jgi:hypothetical protein
MHRDCVHLCSPYRAYPLAFNSPRRLHACSALWAAHLQRVGPGRPRGVGHVRGGPRELRGRLATASVKVTGLAQKLGQLEAVNRDLQSKSWANLQLLGQPCNVRAHGRSGHLAAAWYTFF